MQGRLSPMIDNRIQSFPWKGWQKEFEIASKNNINTILMGASGTGKSHIIQNLLIGLDRDTYN